MDHAVLHHAVLQAVNNEDQLQINPGSATGAYSTFSESVQPSFVLMDLEGSKVGCWLPTLICGAQSGLNHHKSHQSALQLIASVLTQRQADSTTSLLALHRPDSGPARRSTM